VAWGGTEAAVVPDGFVGPVLRSVSLMAVGGAATDSVSPRVGTIVQDLLRGIAMTRLKMAVVLVLAVGLLGTGAGALAWHAGAGPQTDEQAARDKQAHTAPQGKNRRTQPAPGNEGTGSPEAQQAKRKEQEREREHQLVISLRDARDRLEHVEQEYRKLEEQWTEETIQARRRLLQAQEHLHVVERTQAAERRSERSEIEALEAIAHQPEGRPPVPREMAQEGVRKLKQRVKTREEERTGRLIAVRDDLVFHEECLRRVERAQALQRERAEARVRAAAEQLMYAEGRLVGSEQARSRAGDLEGKLEKLIREVGELRRAVEQNQLEKDSPRAP
jgi:hypothetical protein